VSGEGRSERSSGSPNLFPGEVANGDGGELGVLELGAGSEVEEEGDALVAVDHVVGHLVREREVHLQGGECKKEISGRGRGACQCRKSLKLNDFLHIEVPLEELLGAVLAVDLHPGIVIH
jgi:hypothetical protein